MLKHWTLVMTAALLSACGQLPSLEGRSISHALLAGESRETALGRGLAPLVEQHPGKSGVVALGDPLDAFAARMLLISTAQRSIDIQYYIWRNDITGNLLLDALHEAARRQVRIRLLLDDNGISGLDEKLALLSAEPNVEVRLFNPFPLRSFKWLGFVTDFSRLNRRMHNKSFTVDGQASIVGGRNIGDEYFGATQGVVFADLDVLVAGAVVDEVSKDFDRYWNSTSAYPVESLIRVPDAQRARQLRAEEADAARLQQAEAYVRTVAQSRFVEDLVAGTLSFDWVPVSMVSDDPRKVLNQAPQEALLFPRLVQMLGMPSTSLDLISPYFVPTGQGVDTFGALREQGVRVRILTNALEATDVTAVHAGYAKYRVPLLEKGVELFEMRRRPTLDMRKEKAGPFGSSASSLHAKTFAVDGKHVFVGSFNFDPRSARLNTELGFVIESESMAQAVSRSFEVDVPEQAYRLELEKHDKDSRLVWVEKGPQGEQRLRTEPSTSFWRRLYVKFLSLFPIEPLL